MTEVVLTIGMIGVGFCFWMLFCNERTYRQRGEMLESMKPGSREFSDYMAIFHTVTYHEHMWALVKLQNPYALYTVPYHVIAMREEAFR